MRRVWLGLIAALVVSGCERDGGIIGQANLPNISGKFVFEDDYRTVALTSVQHSIYYVIGTKRLLVFKGAGGSVPRLSLLNPDTILVRYCGGSIYKVASPFFDNEADNLHGLRLLRIQPVTEPGLMANGRAIC